MNIGTDTTAQGCYPLLKQPATINRKFFQFSCQALNIPEKLKVARLCLPLSLVQLLVIAEHLGTLHLSSMSRKHSNTYSFRKGCTENKNRNLLQMGQTLL